MVSGGSAPGGRGPAVTGANGHLGRRLLRALASEGPVRALVRSTDAAEQVRRLGLGASVETRIVDYADPDGLTEALRGCTGVVHLVGIIRESAANRYVDAHQSTCAALAAGAARAGVAQVVYLSILGAAEDSANACLASRGAAERLLAHGPVPAAVIRVPMVLGEGDFACRALAARARRRVNLVLRGTSLEQPIYAGDVVAAMMRALDLGRSAVFDLAGPESLPRAELTRRAAAILGRRTRVISSPQGAGRAVARVLEAVLAEPPVTRAMLGVLDHDDCVDSERAADALGITLTPLNETLRRCLHDAGAGAH